MTSQKREGPIKQVTVRQDGPVLLAEVAMALLLADLCAVVPPSSSPPLCGVQVMMGSHDGEMNGGASLVAWDSSAPWAFFCLGSAGERTCGQVPACAVLGTANERPSSA